MTRLSTLPCGIALALALGLMQTACGSPGADSGGFADAAPRPDARPGVPDAAPDAAPLPDAAPPPPDAAPPDAGEPDATPPPDAPTNPAGPDITVLEPTDAVGSTAADVIVTSTTIDILCEALPDATTMRPVNPNSVVVTAIGPGGGIATTKASPVSGQANQFRGTVSVEDFENGPLIVRCSASDTATPAATDSAENENSIDLGPNVVFITPTANEPFRSEITVLFQVLPDPVTPSGDTGAAIDADSVTVSIGGRAGTLSESGGFFSSTFLFDDFTPPLSGSAVIEVRASNTRQAADGTDAPVERVRRITFIADDIGPTIVITEPGEAELVAGVIDITATVTDDAGIGSVQGTLGRTNPPFALVPLGNNQFGATIDTRTFTDKNEVYPLLEVTATDGVGNRRTVGQQIALDNQPPLVTLDSPDMREFRVTPDFRLLSCSERFDPLGRDAVNFGQIVPQLFDIRARAEDQRNGPDDIPGIVFPVATVDLNSVELYLLDDSALELLDDLDGNGICDEINPDVDPILNPEGPEASLINLSAVPEDGASHFVASFIDVLGSDSAINDLDCLPEDETETRPANLCLSVDATRVIDTPTGEPAIFGISPIDDNRCMGNAFDTLPNNVADGWACLVVRAEDQLGNVGVSKIMPVCVDTDGDPSDCNGVNNGDGTITPPDTVCPSENCNPQTDFADLPDRQLRFLQVVGFTECSDGVDNDDDGFTDIDDPECNGTRAGTSED